MMSRALSIDLERARALRHLREECARLGISFQQNHETVPGKGGRSVRKVYRVGECAFRRITDAEHHVRLASASTNGAAHNLEVVSQKARQDNLPDG